MKSMAPTKSAELEEKLQRERNEAEERVAERRAKQLGFSYLNLVSVKAPTDLRAMSLVPEEEAKRSLLIPLQLVEKKLLVAAFDPTAKEASAVLERLRRSYDTSVVVASARSIAHASLYYQYVSAEQKEISGKVAVDAQRLRAAEREVKNIADLTKTIKAFKSPYVSQVFEVILAGALTLKASDIHIEPTAGAAAIRLRIDGLLHPAYTELERFMYQSLLTRIKLLSNLKLNIKNEPQDGRFTVDLEDRDIEIRTSIIPSEYGETVVMRLLDPSSLYVNLEELGFRPDDLAIAKRNIQKPNGLILNTGPTGSGKTTTLYAFLRSITKPEIKIITIEDPIEYHLPGISQTQINLDAHYTFASGLRSILRQDPNVILVGEVRDRETAEIALNAALTGHLVFSTLHTNDAVGAIPRLIDLGAKPQILGASLSLVIAQRLVRRLCVHCRERVALDAATEQKIRAFLAALPERVDRTGFSSVALYKPTGCNLCAEVGYRGRVSLFELFEVTEAVEQAIYQNPTEIEIKNLAREQGMVTMQEDGVIKTLQGITTLDEVERLTGKILLLR